MVKERIKELAEQAAQHAITKLNISGTDISIDSGKYEQKFAELIIKECANIAKASDKYGTLAWLEIERHFGIK